MTYYLKKSIKIMKNVDEKLYDLKMHKTYKQPIKPNLIINILFQTYRKIFLPIPQGIIFITTVCLLTTIVESITSRRIQNSKSTAILACAILISTIALQTFVLIKTKNWKRKIWYKSQKKILRTINIKTQNQRFFLINILENYLQEIIRKKESTKNFWIATSINIFITTINGFFIIISAFIQKNNLHKVYKIIYPIMINVMAFAIIMIIFSIYVYLMMKPLKNDLKILSRKGRIETVIEQLYVFNFKVMLSNNRHKNTKKSKTKSQQNIQ
ncbi:hypothetical protein [Leuconostoc pseudomesenteroides]|uniref:hypothetical protein n=1 Tax=Leuconostoc pseudomesenteroides TaxID=33968 RepID=UPI0032E03EEF